MSDDATEASWHGASSCLDDPEERRVLFAALDSFRQYRRLAHQNITHRRRQNFYALPEAQWKMLAAPPFNVLSHLDDVDDAIDANADIASEILKSGLAVFGVPSAPDEPLLNGSSTSKPSKVSATTWKGAATPADMEKAKSTIRQFWRDWSAEGAVEREACYGPVLKDLNSMFAPSARNTKRILIPGAGLGRLVFEVCKMGFFAEGNEISFHQLMASNWVLNCISAAEEHKLFPFALNFSNNVRRVNQLREVKVPDVHPGTELENASISQKVHAVERMAMTASDFIVLYGDRARRDMFDVVVTVFFIDTAPNVLRYIETIKKTLKPGGYWINLGPLLWHFAEGGTKSEGSEKGVEERGDVGIGERGSVELTLEEMILLVESMGFRIEHNETLEGVGYSQDPESMLQTTYRCSHLVARKIDNV